VKTALLTAVAMLAFATNSILARLALSGAHIDPLAYTGIRLVSGAAVLAAIAWLRSGRTRRQRIGDRGSRIGAVSLLLYAAAFSIAYGMVGAGPGALILFASVQIGMLGWSVARGDRPAPLEWTGMAVAFAALAYLLSPGLVAPSLIGSLLMIVAGLSWGAYCLVGGSSRSPMIDTAGNFIRCVPIGVVLIVVGAITMRPDARGLSYALASGALASGLGYVIWYGVLPRLARTTAAIVQLTVPAIAAAGGVVFIDEPLTRRLLIASAGIVGGVALAMVAAERRRRLRPASADIAR